MFNKMIPLLPPNGNRDLTCDLKGDFKNSVRVEKFRIGEKAVYIPAGFSWKYLLKEVQVADPVRKRRRPLGYGGAGPSACARRRRDHPGAGKRKERAKSAGADQ